MAHLKTNPNISLPKPTKTELEKSINEIGYRGTDRKYGVCDNTARRWAMAYGIKLVEKCVLKARKRKETILMNGILEYKVKRSPTGKLKEKKLKEKKVNKKNKTSSFSCP